MLNMFLSRNRPYVNRIHERFGPPLYFACRLGHQNCVDTLLRQGADVVATFHGKTPWRVARGVATKSCLRKYRFDKRACTGQSSEESGSPQEKAIDWLASGIPDDWDDDEYRRNQDALMAEKTQKLTAIAEVEASAMKEKQELQQANKEAVFEANRQAALRQSVRQPTDEAHLSAEVRVRLERERRVRAMDAWLKKT